MTCEKWNESEWKVPKNTKIRGANSEATKNVGEVGFPFNLIHCLFICFQNEIRFVFAKTSRACASSSKSYLDIF